MNLLSLFPFPPLSGGEGATPNTYAPINPGLRYKLCPKLAPAIAGLFLAAGSLFAATISEDFATDPSMRGWRNFGETNLIHWNAFNQNLSVTWDSSRPNSYFYLPLSTILNREDHFGVAFDLLLTHIEGGVNPDKPSTFQLAIGFCNLLNSTGGNFFRGNNFFAPNLIEFNYFPDTGFGPTVWPSIFSTNSILNYNGPGDYAILELPLAVIMRVTLNYSNRVLMTTITTNGTSIGSLPSVALNPTFTDFRVGTFAVESYNDAGQDPQYGGSLLADGMVDNILITLPPGPVNDLSIEFANAHWQVTFLSRTNWAYRLERSVDFSAWNTVSGLVWGNGTTLTLSDTNVPLTRSFYRVSAQRP